MHLKRHGVWLELARRVAATRPPRQARPDRGDQGRRTDRNTSVRAESSQVVYGSCPDRRVEEQCQRRSPASGPLT